MLMYVLVALAVLLVVGNAMQQLAVDTPAIDQRVNIKELSFKFNAPAQLWKSKNDILYIAEFGGNKISAIPRNGDLYSIAELGHQEGVQSGLTTSHPNALVTSPYLRGPFGLVGDDEDFLYVSAFHSNRIIQLSLKTHELTVIVGANDKCGCSGDEDTPGIVTLLCGPRGLALHQGILFIADSLNHKIRGYNVDAGVVRTMIGGLGGGFLDNVPPLFALLNNPYDLWVDNKDDIFVADYGNNRIRVLRHNTGLVSTLSFNEMSDTIPQPTSVMGNNEGSILVTMDTAGSSIAVLSESAPSGVVLQLNAAHQARARHMLVDEKGLAFVSIEEGVVTDDSQILRLARAHQTVLLNEGLEGKHAPFVVQSVAISADVQYRHKPEVAAHDANHFPTFKPTWSAEDFPTFFPTASSDDTPSFFPTAMNSDTPSFSPTMASSDVPSLSPTMSTSDAPSLSPTAVTSDAPSFSPTAVPSLVSSFAPSVSPSAEPTRQPSATPSVKPSPSPTEAPTTIRTAEPSRYPTFAPSEAGVANVPTVTPIIQPTLAPSVAPSPAPTVDENIRRMAPANITSIAWAKESSLIVDFRTEVAVDVTVSDVGGTVYCAAFPSTASFTAVSQIIAAGNSRLAATQQVQIKMTALIPSTNYFVFCTTVSVIGNNILPLSASKKVSAEVSTDCCKDALVGMSTTSIFVSSPAVDAASFSLAMRPSTVVQATLRFDGVGGDVPQIFPSVFTFRNTSNSLKASATVVGSTAGNYTLVATLSGQSASEYSVKFTSSRTVLILGLDQEPPTPELISGSFSADGSYVELLFDSQTNGAGYSSSFPCTTLLAFTTNASAVCQFSSRSTIKIYQSSRSFSPFMLLGTLVTVRAGTELRGYCVSGNTAKCNKWSTVASTTVVIDPPAVPQLPNVIVSGPSSVGACQSVLLDLTSSSGGAGRPWDTMSLSVSRVGSTGDDSELQTFLSNSYKMSPPSAIAASLLAKGVNYAFTANLCNFLNACSATTKIVEVTTSSSVVPVVTIDGGAARRLGRDVAVDIKSTAFTEDCNGKVSYSSLRYDWSLSLVSGNLNGLDLSTIKSSSTNPSKFKLAPFQLPAGATYRISVSVVHVSTEGQLSTASTASTQVTIVAGSIFASIKGGNQRLVKTGATTTISAAASFDQDVQGLSGASAGLKFSWSCSQISPTFSSTCGNTMSVNAATTSSEVVELAPLTTAANTVSRITVLVYDATRSSTAYTDVSVTSEDVSQLVITTAPASLASVPTNRKFTLEASLDIVAACDASWSVNDPSVDIDTGTLTTLKKHFDAGTGFTFRLALAPNTLPQSAGFLFFIKCGPASASISVTTNGAPLPGKFLIDPTLGSELKDKFAFSANDWSDTDLPITYEFSFSSGNAYLVAQGRSQTSYTSTKLPAGPVSSGNMLDCALDVFDNYDAKVTVHTSVQVDPLSADEQASQLSSLLGSSADASLDEKKGSVSVASSVMNRVNCTLAPDCANLNRKKCSKTAHTCGACVSKYMGDDGDANTACAAVQSRRRLAEIGMQAATTCTQTSDCNDALKICNSTLFCEFKPRACDCSNHGSCFYISVSTGLRVDTCQVSDFSCKAQCHCTTGYSGPSCGISDVDLASKRALRASLVDTLKSVIASDDVTSGSLQSWSAYLDSVVSSPYELGASDLSVVQSLSNTTSMYGRDLASDYSQMEGILSAVDAFMSVSPHFDYNSGGEVVSNNTAASALDILTNFADFICASLVFGQSDVSYVFNNFRILGSLVSVADLQTKGLVVPQSTGEQSFADAPSSLSLVPVATAPSDSLLAAALIQVHQRSVTHDTSAFFSDPIRLKIVNLAHPDQSAAQLVSKVEFTIRNNDAVDFAVYGNGTAPVYETNCTSGVVATTTYTCPISGEVITHACNGKKAGTYVSYCPVVQPGCNKLDIDTGDASVSSTCTLVSFFGNYTTCSCELVSSGYSRRRLVEGEEVIERKLTSSTGSKLLESSGAVDLAAAVEYISYDFKNTFRAANELSGADGAEKALTIILLFVILWSIGLIAAGVMHYRETVQIRKSMAALGTSSPSQAEDAKHLINSYLESIIPAVYQPSETAWKRFWKEITLHHRYVHLFVPDTRRSDLYDRFYRTFRILSIQTLSIFLLAVFFDVQRPADDGSCDDLGMDSCLDKKTILDHTQSFCKWSVNDNNVGACEYDDNNFSERALVYVIIITTVVTTALKLPLDQLLRLWICPIANDAAVVPVGSGGAVSTGVADRAVPKGVMDAHAMTQNIRDAKEVNVGLSRVEIGGNSSVAGGVVDMHTSVEVEVSTICNQVLVQRHALTQNTPESGLYEMQWGIDQVANPTELLKSGQPTQAFLPLATQSFTDCITETKASVHAKAPVFSSQNRANAGLELMHLFMIDLLGRKTNSAVIFRNKFDVDFERLSAISMPLKIFAVAMVLALNAFFVYYTLLRGVYRGLHWQNTFLQTVLIQFAIEVVVFETIEVFFLQYVVPESVREDVDRAVRVLKTIGSHTAELIMSSDEEARGTVVSSSLFSAPNHFFVSNRLAHLRPDLLESKIVMSYRNYFPGMLCKTWPHYRVYLRDPAMQNGDAIVHRAHIESHALRQQARDLRHRGSLFFGLATGLASGVIYTLQTLGLLSIIIQKVIVRGLQTMVLSGLTLLWYAAVDRTALFVPVVVIIVAVLTFLIVRALRNPTHSADNIEPAESKGVVKPVDLAAGIDGTDGINMPVLLNPPSPNRMQAESIIDVPNGGYPPTAPHPHEHQLQPQTDSQVQQELASSPSGSFPHEQLLSQAGSQPQQELVSSPSSGSLGDRKKYFQLVDEVAQDGALASMST